MAEWECSRDLAGYLTDSQSLPSSSVSQLIARNPDQLDIIELGCGRGSPCCSLVRVLRTGGFLGKIHACFQDMDQGTIENVTKPFVFNELADLLHISSPGLEVEFVGTAWDDFAVPSGRYHIVLSSECVYREDLFAPHAKIVEKALSEDGLAFVAAKRYYFGCGGGTIGFSEFLEATFANLQVELVKTIENGMSNTREILSVSHRSS